MSTDFSVVNDDLKTWWHLGQRMAAVYSFGYGSNDKEGASVAAQLIEHNLGYRLRIVDIGMVPEGYREIDINQPVCDKCFGTTKVPVIECTCYEVVGSGHQMGCPCYGLPAGRILELSGEFKDCPDCMYYLMEEL